MTVVKFVVFDFLQSCCVLAVQRRLNQSVKQKRWNETRFVVRCCGTPRRPKCSNHWKRLFRQVWKWRTYFGTGCIAL